MNYTELRSDFSLKAFGVKNTSNLSTAQTDTYVNKGYLDLYKFMIENDDVARAYFSTYDTAVAISSGVYKLPADLMRVLQVVDSAKQNEYKQKTNVDRAWTEITSGSIYVTYIKNPEVIGDGTGGTVQTPSLPSQFHDIITDYAAFEYFNDLGGAYVADAKKWAEVAGTKALGGRKQLYWDVMQTGNRNFLIDARYDYGYYYVNYGYDSSTYQRIIKLYAS